jgi:hypothetical protein
MNTCSVRRLSTSAVLAVAGLVAGLSSVAAAQPFAGTTPVALDRWNYPFGDFGGARTSAPIFWTVGTSGFDDRDAEFLVGFNTTALVPAGQPASSYNVTELRVSASVFVADATQRFVYDGTHDTVETYYADIDPSFIADSDAGRPIELFACGYRPTSNVAGAPLWSATTFLENSPFASTGANPPPARNNRNVFPVSYDASGTARNASNHVTGTAAEGGRFEAEPLSTGQTTLSQGALVEDGTVFTFTVDLTRPGALSYVQEGLASGRLNFIISSLHPSSQPGTGGAPLVYPIFYTKENPFGTRAQLAITGSIGTTPACLADVVADGSVDGGDFIAFINSFAIGDASIDPVADVIVDGTIDGNDFIAFINAFAAGC